MDTARDAITFELVEGEELWTMDFVDSQGYICRGCTTQVFPASYDKKRNKKRPYFSLGPVNKHKSGCDVDGAEKIVKHATKERVGNPEGFPLPFPNKLNLMDERPVSSSNATGLAGSLDGRTRTRANDGAMTGRHHGHTVKTIRPACRTFINFPHDREHLPLSIPDVPGDTYAKVFWYLGGKKPEHFKVPRRLYYASIRWTVEPVLADTHCELTLNAGEWDEEKRAFKSLSRVHLNWSGWSQSRRDAFIREFEATREEAAEQAKSESKIKGWVFFVGTQDSDEPGLFRVDDHRLICCLSAEMVWPKRK